MALKEDYKDAVFAGLRKYKMLDNGDGTVSPVDMTEYETAGDKFGAKDVNAITKMVNCTGDAFDPGRDYEVGDYTIYDNTVWKFTTAHPAGEWDESHVEKTRILVEIAEQNKNFAELTAKTDKTGTMVNIIAIRVHENWENVNVAYNISDFRYIYAQGRSSSNNRSRGSVFVPVGYFKASEEIDIPLIDGKFCGFKYISENSIGIVTTSTTYDAIDVFGVY